MRKILVTGHKGFIGKHLTHEFDLMGIKWVGFDLLDGQDIRDQLSLEKVFELNNLDTVIHLAALTGARRGNDYPQEYFDTNVIGSYNVAKMCEKYGVKKLIAFSSSSAKSCQNIYGITKHTMELIIDKINIKSLAIIRPFNVYGENGRQDQVIWKWKALADAGLPIEYHGNLKRNYTYIGDLIKHIVFFASEDFNFKNKRIFDIGNPQTICLEEILNIFKDKYPNLKVIEKNVDDTDVYPGDSLLFPSLLFPTDFITKVKELIQ